METAPKSPQKDREEQAEIEHKRRLKVPRKKVKGTSLTEREVKLADLAMAGVSGKDAAMLVYNPSNPISATSIASEVLSKPDVRAYMESKALRAAEIVMGHAENAKSEMVSLIAAKDILDRTGFKTSEPAKDPNQGATYNFIFSKETQEDVARIEATIRARLTGTHAQENPTTVEADQEGPAQA